MLAFWDHPTKYYSTRVDVDLFNRITVIKLWAGKFTKKGRGFKVMAVDSIEEAHKEIERDHKRRLQHGYYRKE